MLFRSLIALLFLWVSQASAQLIRDTEIESGLRHYSYPIIKNAGLDVRNVKIHIIRNEALNAFVAGGQNIFLHSGMLIAADSPDEVLGVLAHEIGHIAGGHLVGLRTQAQASSRTALLSFLVSVPLALVAGQGGAAIGGAIAGQSIAQGQLLNYTQSMESSADQAAIGYLQKQNISPKGIVDFLHRLKKLEDIYGTRAAYLRSHPLTTDRIKAAEFALKEFPDLQTAPQIFNLIHARIRGKLIGHLWDYNDVMKRYPVDIKTTEARYARSFAYMLKGKHDQALAEIDALLTTAPDDIFYLEAKGDIYRNAGKMMEARQHYSQALDVAPWAALIHSIWANSLTIAERNNANLVREALDHANKAVALEPRLYSAWLAKATMESALGNKLLADVAGAEASLLRRDIDRALFLAQRAEKNLPEGSEAKQQALDIINRCLQIRSLQN